MHLNELQSISLCPLFIRHSVTGYCEQSSENIGFVEVCAFVFYVGGHKLQKDSIDGIIWMICIMVTYVITFHL